MFSCSAKQTDRCINTEQYNWAPPGTWLGTPPASTDSHKLYGLHLLHVILLLFPVYFFPKPCLSATEISPFTYQVVVECLLSLSWLDWEFFKDWGHFSFTRLESQTFVGISISILKPIYFLSLYYRPHSDPTLHFDTLSRIAGQDLLSQGRVMSTPTFGEQVIIVLSRGVNQPFCVQDPVRPD